MKAVESEYDDHIQMDDGTKYYCFGQCIGIDVDESGECEISYGWDGTFSGGSEKMTIEHQIELSKHMIKRWKEHLKYLKEMP